MSFGYQQERVLEGVDARAAILNLNARHNRLYTAGDRAQWMATFKHTGASLTVDGSLYAKVWEAWESLAAGSGRLTTADHEIDVDGVHATQQCVAIRFGGNCTTTGTFVDTLLYERGGWYYASRELTWDP